MNPTSFVERRCVKEVIAFLRAQAEAGNLQLAYEVRATVNRRFASPERAQRFAAKHQASVWRVWFILKHWNERAVFEEALADKADSSASTATGGAAS